MLDAEKLDEVYKVRTCTRDDINDIMDALALFVDLTAIWPDDKTKVPNLTKKIDWEFEAKRRSLVDTGRMQIAQDKIKATMQRELSVNTASTACTSGDNQSDQEPALTTGKNYAHGEQRGVQGSGRQEKGKG